MKFGRNRRGKSTKNKTRKRYFGISDGRFHGGVVAPDRPGICFHVGLRDGDGKVLFSTRADGASLKSSIPDGHGFSLPIPLDWLTDGGEAREFQFEVIETGEVFPEVARTLPVSRLIGSLGSSAESKGAIKSRFEHAAEVVAHEFTAETVLLGTHEMTRTGAPLILLEIARHLHRDHGKEIILLCEAPRGTLYSEFTKVCRLVVEEVHAATKLVPQEVAHLFRALAKGMGHRKALINSLSSGKLMLACRDADLPFISLVHEYPYAFDQEWTRKCFDAAEAVVFPCDDVLKSHQNNMGTKHSEACFSILPQGCYQLDSPEMDEAVTRDLQAELRSGVDRPQEAKWVVACGTIDHRKGFDWFASLIREHTLTSTNAADTHFVWIGKIGDGALLFHVQHDLEAAGLADKFHHVGELEDVRPILQMADVFVLCSRIDPFPSVVLESFAHGVPVLGFDRDQGCADMIRETGFGIVVPYQDLQASSRSIDELLSSSSEQRVKVQGGGRAYVESNYRFKDYVDQLASRLFDSGDPPAPDQVPPAAAALPASPAIVPHETDAEVTVCVPVYRRGKKLEPTLKSLRDQTFTDFSVLIRIEPEEGGESLATCEKFAGGDKRFHIVQNAETLGWGGNIRALMQQVTTPFFMVLPHDDALHPECLERLVLSARDNPEAVVTYPDIYFFGAVGGRQVVEQRGEEADQRIANYFLSGGDPEFWKGLTRRRLLADGEAFPTHGSRSFAAEYEWALRLLTRGQICRVPTPLYYKRIHGSDSDSVSTHWLHRLSERERLRELRDHHGRLRCLAEEDFSQNESVRIACDLAWLRRVMEFSDGQSEFLAEESALLEQLGGRAEQLASPLRDRALACTRILHARQAAARQSHSEAETLYREALELWPEHREGSLLLIKTLLRQSKVDEAVSRFIDFNDALPQSAPDWRCGELLDWISSELKHALGK